MTTWAETKHRAIQAFDGELPTAQTEADILDAFQAEPVAVLHALDSVIVSFKAGKARSGFAVWRSRCSTAAITKHVDVDTQRQPAQIKLAEAWIRNTGGYIDQQTELEDELFGDRGRLKEWPNLQPRMVQLWENQRARFARADQEAEERLARQGDTYRGLRGPQPARHACKICGTSTRGTTPYCAQHRSSAAEDFRHADVDWLDEIAPDPEETT